MTRRLTGPGAALLSAALAVAPAGCGGGVPAFAGPGGEGDDCTATRDCADGLSCRGAVCRSPGWVPGDDPGGAEVPDGADGSGGQPQQARPPFVRFEEIGGRAGVARDPSHGAASALDHDGDGLPDILVTDPTGGLRLFGNRGDATFADRTASAGLDRLRFPGGYGALVADYDNDGDPDVYVTRDGFADPLPNSLLRNDGGVFTDVAVDARVAGNAQTIGAVFLDYDLDGWLDLYVPNGVAQGDRNVLYRNRGDGRFEDATAEAGVGDMGRGFQALAGDYDDDGDPDLYVVNRREPNLLYRNDGDGTFTEVAAALGVAEPAASIGALFVDYDGDEDLDLFVAPENDWAAVQAWEGGRIAADASLPALYRNDGGRFTDVAQEAGVVAVYAGRSVLESDCDGDGLTDLVIGAGSPGPGPAMWNYVYRNNGDGTFTDEAISAGVGPTAMTHGMTVADFDGDGFEDIYLVAGHTVSEDAPHGNALYRNLGSGSGWLKVRLAGTVSNRDAIGARAVLRAGGRAQVREVRGGQPFAGTRDRTLVFGLGALPAAESLEVRWPSGRRTVIDEGLGAGGVIDVVEPP